MRIPANGGYLEVRGGKWVFVLDEHVYQRMVRHDRSVPRAVNLEPMWSNPTPPFAPTLGGFIHPETGHYCHPRTIKDEWSWLWMRTQREHERQIGLG